MPILGDGLIRQRSAATNWWLAGGISAANCVAAYQPKGAASLAASYINLANPGVNNAAPGVAPTFNTVTGWTFNGTTQYLTTGIVPAAGWSMLCRFSGLTGTDGDLIGSSNANAFFFFRPRRGAADERLYGYGSAFKSGGTRVDNGVMVLAGATGYLNGASEATTIGTFSGTANSLYIGAENAGSLLRLLSGNIQLAAIYNTTITLGQVGAATTAANTV